MSVQSAIAIAFVWADISPLGKSTYVGSMHSRGQAVGALVAVLGDQTHIFPGQSRER